MTETSKVIYVAKTHTTGGREGASRTDDGRLDVKLAPPGTSASGTNPEQLFAAGWSACFLSALKLIAAQQKVKLPVETSIDAEVDLHLAGSHDYSLSAVLNVNLPGMDHAIAQRLMDAGHQTCPYSKATHGNIEVTTNIITS